MPHAFGNPSRRATLLACIALPAITARPAGAQATSPADQHMMLGNDMLTPLGEPTPAATPGTSITLGDDLLTPLGEPAPPASPDSSLALGDDLLTPLGEPTPAAIPDTSLALGDDLLTPLEWREASPPFILVPDPLLIDVAEFERELAEQEAFQQQRDREWEEQGEQVRSILVQRTYVDPCGSFTVSWGGTKRCQPLKRTRWELTDVGREDEEEAGSEPPAPAGDDGRTSPGTAPGAPPPAVPTPSASSPGSPSPSGMPGPAGASPGSAPSAAGGAESGSGASVQGTTSSYDAEGFATIGEFAVRIDRATQIANGDIDLLATFKTRGNISRLIGNGDWRVYVTDADGVSTDTTALYSPAPGNLQPFAQMPYVSASAPAQVRLRVVLPAGMAPVTSATVMLTGQHSATYRVGPLGSDAAPPPPAGTVPGSALKHLEVRADQLEAVGQTTQLSYSVRNTTDRPQFAHGTYLQFSATRADGTTITNTGRVHAVRGALGRHYEGVTVLPGQTGRFRVVFDAPDVRGPITVTDGTTTATLALPVPAEPVW